MRILQVVALLTPGGEYGGPATVALGQARALAARGHRVTLVAGVRGRYRPAPVPGVDVQTFAVHTVGPGRSFTRIGSPTMLRWLAGHAGDFDVAHVHLGRDLVTAPAARLLVGRIPTHVQTHGMVAPRTSPAHRVFDALLMRPVLRRAGTVYCLDERERTGIRAVGADRSAIGLLTNGVPTAAPRPPRTAGAPEVLFLARLHERKRPVTFVTAALQLAVDHAVRFTVVGPDEGQGAAIDRLLAAARADGVHRRGVVAREPAVAPDDVLDRLARADVYVLPAVHEPLGVSVLEAMSVGLPVVVTDTCGIADRIAAAGAGAVVDDTVESLSAAIAAMLDDPDAARRCGDRARAAVQEHWSADAVARQLADSYAGRAHAGERGRP
ncbi:glycosyltransferase [Gordonia sp. (in: high G+C Gram-positive bacteria)]|uniref:glycosyltransferase n=1 Tax=Gordonia sp. (in: high G+C Gram-positive bacteria) TaxID=84139 RepID=UPI003C780E23